MWLFFVYWSEQVNVNVAGSETVLTLPEAYSEPFQTSKNGAFHKILHFRCLLGFWMRFSLLSRFGILLSYAAVSYAADVESEGSV